MKVIVLSLIAGLAVAGNLAAQDHRLTGSQGEQKLETCSAEFWNRAVTVATGHGRDFEIEARQIGRNRCDCVYPQGKAKICNASVVSADEAVPPGSKE